GTHLTVRAIAGGEQALSRWPERCGGARQVEGAAQSLAAAAAVEHQSLRPRLDQIQPSLAKRGPVLAQREALTGEGERGRWIPVLRVDAQRAMRVARRKPWRAA